MEAPKTRVAVFGALSLIGRFKNREA